MGSSLLLQVYHRGCRPKSLRASVFAVCFSDPCEHQRNRLLFVSFLRELGLVASLAVHRHGPVAWSFPGSIHYLSGISYLPPGWGLVIEAPAFGRKVSDFISTVWSFLITRGVGLHGCVQKCRTASSKDGHFEVGRICCGSCSGGRLRPNLLQSKRR